MASRSEMVTALDEYLDIAAMHDSSLNGLQIEGADEVARVALAVDAAQATIDAAIAEGCQMLAVHHGLFWGPQAALTGVMGRRVRAAFAADLSLYAAHLPLDCHPVVGNNAELARLLGFTIDAWFGEYKGTPIGALARPQKPLQRDQLLRTMEQKLGAAPEVLAFGPRRIRRAGIISGGGAMFAEEARRVGCDTLITGESSHSAYHMAKEAGVNLIYGGHYATETVGLRALQRLLKKRYPVTTKFIPAPTGY